MPDVARQQWESPSLGRGGCQNQFNHNPVMQTDAYRLWSSRIVTFSVCALATASAAYWGFKTWNSSTPVNTPKLAVAWTPPGSPKAVAQALGGGLAAPMASAENKPSAASRYVLTGVVASGAQGGAALISVDGQEAKPVRVGAQVEGGWMLASVTSRRAVLSSGTGAAAARVTLELPLPDH